MSILSTVGNVSYPEVVTLTNLVIFIEVLNVTSKGKSDQIIHALQGVQLFLKKL